MRFFQDTTKSVYNALESSLSCNCRHPHGVNLRLFAPQRILRREDKAALLRNLDFHLALSYFPNEMIGPQYGPWNWAEMVLRSVGFPESPSLPSNVQTQPMPPQKQGKHTKRVEFAKQFTLGASVGPTVAAVNMFNPLSSNSILNGPKTRRTMVQLPNLCHTISTVQEDIDCYGHISDQSVMEYGRFGVYHVQCSKESGSHSLLSIEKVIENLSLSTPGPSLTQKLSLASVITSSILQLHETPWLPEVLTSRDIYLLQRDGKMDYERIYVGSRLPCHRLPMVKTPYSNTHPPDTSNTNPPKASFGNRTMWALLTLLVELILWKPLNDLVSWDTNHEHDPHPNQIFDFTTKEGAQRVGSLLDKVDYAVGQEYQSAVKCCLRYAFGYPDLDLNHNDWHEEIYNKVIVPIEDSSEKSKRLTVNGRLF